MNGIYWLIILIVATLAGIYIRYKINQPSDLREIEKASLSYQVLENMGSYVTRRGIDLEKSPLSIADFIMPYLKERGLNRRERNDIIRYMKREDWIYLHDPPNADLVVISPGGRRELETNISLRRALENTVYALRNFEISGDEAKAQAALVAAATLRTHKEDIPPENRQGAENAAKEIEDAVNAHDPEKIDRAIDRVSKILQIMTLSLPFLRDVIRILGLLSLA